MTSLGVDCIQRVLRGEIDGGRRSKSVRYDFECGRIDVDTCDLLPEPEWSIELAVSAEIEPVETAHSFHDLARRILSRRIEFKKGIPEKNLRGEKATFSVPCQRIHARKALGQSQQPSIGLAGKYLAVEKGRPSQCAIRSFLDIIGHAFGRAFKDTRRSGFGVDFVDGTSHDAACKEFAVTCKSEAMNSVKRRGRHDNFLCVAIVLRAGRNRKRDGQCRRHVHRSHRSPCPATPAFVFSRAPP